MAKFNFYLNFNGDTEAAFNLYKSVLGGEFRSIMRWNEMPGCGEGNLGESDMNKIMHMELPLSDGNVLMGTDSPASMGMEVTMGTNSHILINADSKEDADRLFAALGEGGKSTMPMQDMFWGAYYGTLADRFGVQWMIMFMNGQPSEA